MIPTVTALLFRVCYKDSPTCFLSCIKTTSDFSLVYFLIYDGGNRKISHGMQSVTNPHTHFIPVEAAAPTVTTLTLFPAPLSIKQWGFRNCY